jgi:hypothetical protein
MVGLIDFVLKLLLETEPDTDGDFDTVLLAVLEIDAVEVRVLVIDPVDVLLIVADLEFVLVVDTDIELDELSEFDILGEDSVDADAIDVCDAAGLLDTLSLTLEDPETDVLVVSE